MWRMIRLKARLHFSYCYDSQPTQKDVRMTSATKLPGKPTNDRGFLNESGERSQNQVNLWHQISPLTGFKLSIFASLASL